MWVGDVNVKHMIDGYPLGICILEQELQGHYFCYVCNRCHQCESENPAYYWISAEGDLARSERSTPRLLWDDYNIPDDFSEHDVFDDNEYF